MEACLTLVNTEVMAVVFKLLGVLRMLIEGQGQLHFVIVALYRFSISLIAIQQLVTYSESDMCF